MTEEKNPYIDYQRADGYVPSVDMTKPIEGCVFPKGSPSEVLAEQHGGQRLFSVAVAANLLCKFMQQQPNTFENEVTWDALTRILIELEYVYYGRYFDDEEGPLLQAIRAMQDFKPSDEDIARANKNRDRAKAEFELSKIMKNGDTQGGVQ